MAVKLPHIEDSELTNYIPPKGDYYTFSNDEEYFDKGQEWKLFGKSAKTEFLYKGKSYQRSVQLVGYQLHGAKKEFTSLVIEFQDGNLTCIHPAHLADMQKSTFGKETIGDESVKPKKKPSSTTKSKKDNATNEPKKKPVSKPKEEQAKPQFELPSDKVHFTATVKEFAKKPNPFSDSDDDILLLEKVAITGDEPKEIGNCWCGYSKTLQKLELQEGQSIEFDAKVVKKKHEDYLYKINNPSKIKIV